LSFKDNLPAVRRGKRAYAIKAAKAAFINDINTFDNGTPVKIVAILENKAHNEGWWRLFKSEVVLSLHLRDDTGTIIATWTCPATFGRPTQNFYLGRPVVVYGYVQSKNGSYYIDARDGAVRRSDKPHLPSTHDEIWNC
jgi:hypothetical protein